MIPVNEIRFNEKSEMIFPVTIYKRQGKFSADVYNNSIEVFEQAQRLFSDILSKESIKYLSESVASIYSGYGFDFSYAVGGLYTLMECTCKSRLSSFKPKNQILDLNQHYDGSLIETIDTKEASEFGQRGKVILKDGKIACVCVENYVPYEDFTEIAVETAKKYRKNGFATECVYALTSELIDNGEKVRYMCNASNEASIRTAAAAGFYEIGQDYYFILEKEVR